MLHSVMRSVSFKVEKIVSDIVIHQFNTTIHAFDFAAFVHYILKRHLFLKSLYSI